jgi:excisionase family DNA binding protein
VSEPIAPAVYLVTEVAQLLKTTEWNVYEMVKRGEIPGAIRIGTKIRIVKRIFNQEMGFGPPDDSKA